MGYSFGGEIGSGDCWGRHVAIYRKDGVKSDRVYARLCLREAGIALRMFLSDVSKHAAFIERAPAHIADVFLGEAACSHCKGDACRFRKSYEVGDRLIEKCGGVAFEFHRPALAALPDCVALFWEFYGSKRKGAD